MAQKKMTRKEIFLLIEVFEEKQGKGIFKIWNGRYPYEQCRNGCTVD